LIAIDEKLERLGKEMLALYGKIANAYGTLGQGQIHRFPAFLTSYYHDDKEFIEFSTDTVALIAESMSRQQFTTTSYPVFIRYKNQDSDWILVCLLKLKEGVGIDEESLDLNESLFFDIGNLREAARINLNKWLEDQQPYLSFIKKGSGRDTETSLFFRDALSCTDYTDAKRNTDDMIRAADGYSESQGWTADRRQEMRAVILDYCKEKHDRDEPVNLRALSARINDQEPDSFVDFVRENQIEVSDTFSPHPTTYNKLRRVSRKFRSISLGFDIEEVSSGRLSYRDDDNSIIIQNPPEDLIHSIKEITGE
jgi:nucleoid-associated protein